MADFYDGRVWAAWACNGFKYGPELVAKTEKQCDEWRTKGLYATDRIGGWPGGLHHKDLVTQQDPELGILRLVDDKYRLIFEQAQLDAHIASNGTTDNPQIDPYLHAGGLYNRSCGFVLQVATSKVIFPDKHEKSISQLWEQYKIDYIAIHYGYSRSYLYWSPEEVKEALNGADWEKAKDTVLQKKANMAIFYSAKNFLEACGKGDLGIRFTSQ